MGNRVPARQILHFNINTKHIQAAADFYCGTVGLQLRMQSESDDGDWRFHGIEEPVSSAGWFLYDDRGPRECPALELVEWRKPATRGSSYDTLIHRGMSSVSIQVASLEETLARVRDRGGQIIGPLSDGHGRADMLIRDPDGVFVELRERPGPTRIASVRIGVADVETSLDWYGLIGFTTTQPPKVDELLVDGTVRRARFARVALPGAETEVVLTQWLDEPTEELPHDKLWTQGMVRMAVSVDDLDEAIAVLNERGLTVPDKLEFALPGTKIGALTVLFLRDPDGFTVELVHRPPRHFARKAEIKGGTA